MMYNGLLMISGRDYYKTESKVSESYKNHALIQLQNTFPDTPLGYIRYIILLSLIQNSIADEPEPR
jgi:hypothetical protein